MSAYVSTLTEVSLPIVIACLAGALLAWKRPVSTETLTDVSLYVLGPCLVIIALARSSEPPSTFSEIALFTLLQTSGSWFVGWSTGRIMRLPPPQQAALTLTTIFSNSNNYGLPVLLLAFGETGFSLGAAYVIGQIILVNTLGLYLAARSSFMPGAALKRVLGVPLVYACAVGVLLYLAHAVPPQGVAKGLELLGNAYPAVVLLILGVQIRNMRWDGLGRIEVWAAMLLRMIVVPLLSLLIIHLLEISGLLAEVLLVESAMPAAVNAVVLTTKYGGDSDMVALTVSATTLLSFLTVPLWISVM